MLDGVGNRSDHKALTVGSKSNWGGKRFKQTPKPMQWMHSNTEECVQDTVKKSIMTVDNKLPGQRKLTIVDPLDNSDEVHT
jgi:hypothetical protein